MNIRFKGKYETNRYRTKLSVKNLETIRGFKQIFEAIYWGWSTRTGDI